MHIIDQSIVVYCRCYNCGDFANHIAAKCPHPPLPKRCHFCKSHDHLIADCPSRKTDTGNSTSSSTGESDGGPEGSGDYHRNGRGEGGARSSGVSGVHSWYARIEAPPGGLSCIPHGSTTPIQKMRPERSMTSLRTLRRCAAGLGHFCKSGPDSDHNTQGRLLEHTKVTIRPEVDVFRRNRTKGSTGLHRKLMQGFSISTHKQRIVWANYGYLHTIERKQAVFEICRRNIFRKQERWWLYRGMQRS